MDNDLIQVRIPKEMRSQVEAIFSGLGLKTGDAVRVFFQHCINANGFPFQLKLKIPNEETLAAMAEADAGQGEKISLSDLRREMGLKPQ